MSRTAAGQGGWGGFSLWGRAGPGKSSAVLARCSVVCCVFCTMQPSAQQGELLHHLLHSPLVHTLSAKTEGGDKHEVGGMHWAMQGSHSRGKCGVQLPGQVAHKPEDLLAEVFLLLWSYSGRGETILLHGLLDPDAQEAEAVLVQGKEDFCKVIHEAAGSLATDALPQSKQHIKPMSSLSLLPPMPLAP